MTKNDTRRAISALLLSAGVLAAIAPLVAVQAGPLDWISGGKRVEGSGKIVKQNRQVSNFHQVAIGISGDVDIRTGGTEGVTVETDDNVLPLIETVVENGTLHIRTVKNNMHFNTRHMRVLVQVRSLDTVSVGGSGNVTADQLRGERVTVDVGGSGSFNVQSVQAPSVEISLGGSGNLKAAGGNAEHLQVSIGGSGNVQVGRLAARDVNVSIGGSGQATVAASKSLNVSVAGSGDVGYYGDPQVSKSMMGSGTVKRLGGSPQ